MMMILLLILESFSVQKTVMNQVMSGTARVSIQVVMIMITAIIIMIRELYWWLRKWKL